MIVLIFLDFLALLTLPLPILQLLLLSFHRLLPPSSSPSPSPLPTENFLSILSTADEEINSTVYDEVGSKWLRLYVDATIGWVCSMVGVLLRRENQAQEVRETDTGKKIVDGFRNRKRERERERERDCRGDRKDWLECIKRLDMAIIVAGAVGPRRKKMIQQLIRYVQSVGLGHRRLGGDEERRNEECPGFMRKEKSRLQLRPQRCDTGRLSHAPQPIPSFPPSSSSSSFQSSSSSSSSLSSSSSSMPTPTLSTYLQSNTYETPFIIRSYASSQGWPALSRWRDQAYLHSVIGPGRVVPVEIGESYTDTRWSQRIVRWEEFWEHVGGTRGGEGMVKGGRRIGSKKARVEVQEGEDSEAEESAEEEDTNRDNSLVDIPPSTPIYLAQHALFEQFPDLSNDIDIPEFAYSSPPPPKYYKQYKPPGTSDGVVINAWIGSASSSSSPFPSPSPATNNVTSTSSSNHTPSPSTYSPPHTDPYYNAYTQILGRKRVWIAPPSPAVRPEWMYTYAPGDQTEEERRVLVKQMRGEGSEPVNGGNASDQVGFGNDGSTSNQMAEMESESLIEPEPAVSATSYMSNTSRVPVFSLDPPSSPISLRPSSSDLQTDTNSLYPDFYKHVLPLSMESILEPGDLLVLPPGWWHAMRGESEAVDYRAQDDEDGGEEQEAKIGVGWSVSTWY